MPSFVIRRMVYHRPAIGLQIHPLAHAHICQGITRRKREREAPVEDVAISFALHRPDDIVRRRFVATSVQFANPP